jgi:hypothetical protein
MLKLKITCVLNLALGIVGLDPQKMVLNSN